MRVLRLQMYACLGLNDVHRRSYSTHLDNQTLEDIARATNDGSNITLNKVSKVAANFIRPAAETEGVAGIINGWGTARYRFVLEVEEFSVGSTSSIAYYIGHTSHMDDAVLHQSAGRLLIDHNLIFFVDSVRRVKPQFINVNGVEGSRLIANGAQQFLYGNGSISSLVNGGRAEYSMRPYDVFDHQNILNDLQSSGYIDPGIVHTCGAIVSGAITSNRRNNSPGTYLYDTLTSHQNAVGVLDGIGGSSSMVAKEAIGYSSDNYAFTDPLFTAMQDIVDDIRIRGQFTYGQLMKLAPHIDDCTSVVRPSELQRYREMSAQGTSNASLYGNVWGAHNTSGWGGSDNETIAAALLVSAIPTIMLENLGVNIRFTATNMTHTGTMEYSTETFSTVNPNMINEKAMLDIILRRIDEELMSVVTCNNQLPVRLVVDSSVYGDTMVHIAINSSELRTFVMPTFADNIASPIVTDSKDKYMKVVNDVYALSSALVAKSPYQNSTVWTPPTVSW